MGNHNTITTQGCKACGRQCSVLRHQQLGWCGIDEGLYVAQVVHHGGEEPALGGTQGVCNVFFPHCTLECIFCQNGQISDKKVPLSRYAVSLPWLLKQIESIWHKGVNTVGFVSGTSYIPWIVRVVDALRTRGFTGTVVYNTHGYDSVAGLRQLAGVVDVYLPDYKYGCYEVAERLSGVRNYPDVALSALREMGNQVGYGLELNEAGVAHRGLLIRHLILPGELENSRAALLNLRTELGSQLWLSLLSQYTPAHHVLRDASLRASALGRTLTAAEYEEIVAFAYSLGFTHGWSQALESASSWIPDFTLHDAFAASRLVKP